MHLEDSRLSAYREEVAERRQKQRVADVQAVMNSETGRRVLWWVVDGISRVTSSSYSGDSLATAYQEGRRAVGLELMAFLQRECPSEFVHALTEDLVQRRLEQEAAPKPEDE